MIISKDVAFERFKTEAKGLSPNDQRNLIREILQEVILCHMKEIGLFHDLAFHGGTSLRLLHRIDRFSEDLDLSLIKANENYPFAKKMVDLEKSLKAVGFSFEFQNKIKADNPIKKYFINDVSFLSDFKDQIGNFIDGEKVKVKLELDVEPPDGQQFEVRKIQSSFSAEILAHDLGTCMGQKIHAVLCRAQSYGLDIIKGRDLYDLEWYLNHQVKPNFQNLNACLNRIGPWKGQDLKVNASWVIDKVDNCLSTKKFDAILADIKPLIPAAAFDKIKSKWSIGYFKDLIRTL
jgi:predicted nucleotidyltransferase component of viral defense system